MNRPPDDAPLVMGIDGGGSKTMAWLCASDDTRSQPPLGKGVAGPANPQSVGRATTFANLERVVEAAFADAGLSRRPVAALCVALAGGDRDDVRSAVAEWGVNQQIAQKTRVTHDAEPILAAGTPDGVGIALISGTGSFAFGRNAGGAAARCGGWGHLFGDEGSGYAIALAGLRAAAQAADGRGPATELEQRLRDALDLETTAELVGPVYARRQDRRWLADLARHVFDAAVAGDAVADRILQTAARELAGMAAALVHRLHMQPDRFVLALGGGVLSGSPLIQTRLGEELSSAGCSPAATEVVAEPVRGAAWLALELMEPAS